MCSVSMKDYALVNGAIEFSRINSSLQKQLGASIKI